MVAVGHGVGLKLGRLTLVGGALWAAGCGSLPGHEPAAASEACNAPLGWEAVAEHARHKYLLFGEVHGTNEAPRIVGDYVCAVASSGAPTLLAVEMPSFLDPALQETWRTDGPFRAAFLAKVPKSFPLGLDGAISQASLDMLERLHRLFRKGMNIDVVAIANVRDAAQQSRLSGLPAREQREAAYADNLSMAASARNYENVVVLVGNLHARKLKVDAGTPYEPMSMKLDPGKVVSLAMHHAGGTAWNCMASAPGKDAVTGPPVVGQNVDCRARDLKGVFAEADGLMKVQIKEDASTGFDGYFYLGQVSATAPP